MDTASSGAMQPESQAEAEFWKQTLRRLTVAASYLPKKLQVQQSSLKTLRKGKKDGVDLTMAQKAVHQAGESIRHTLSEVQSCSTKLPETSLYRPLVSTIEFLVQAQGSTGAAADMSIELRASISKLNKLALNDQRALKRAAEFMDLREQAGFAQPSSADSGGAKRRDPLAPRQSSNSAQQPVAAYSRLVPGPSSGSVGSGSESKVVDDDDGGMEEDNEENFLAELARMEQAVGKDGQRHHGGEFKEAKEGALQNPEHKNANENVFGEGKEDFSGDSWREAGSKVGGGARGGSGASSGVGAEADTEEGSDHENAMDEGTLTLMEQQLNAMPPMQWQGLLAEREADHAAGFIGPCGTSRSSRDSGGGGGSSSSGAASPSLGRASPYSVFGSSGGRGSHGSPASLVKGNDNGDESKTKDDGDDGLALAPTTTDKNGGGDGGGSNQPSWFASSLKAVATAAAANEGGDGGEAYPSYSSGSNSESKEEEEYGENNHEGGQDGVAAGGGRAGGRLREREREEVDEQRAALESVRRWEQGVGERLDSLELHLQGCVKLATSVCGTTASLGSRHTASFVALKERQLADDTEKLEALTAELEAAFEGGAGWFLGVEWQQVAVQHRAEKSGPGAGGVDASSGSGGGGATAGGVFSEKVRYAEEHRAVLEAALFVCQEVLNSSSDHPGSEATVDPKVLTALAGDVRAHLPKLKADLKRLRLFRRRAVLKRQASLASAAAKGASSGSSISSTGGGGGGGGGVSRRTLPGNTASVVTLGGGGDGLQRQQPQTLQQQQQQQQQEKKKKQPQQTPQQPPQHLLASHERQVQDLNRKQAQSHVPALQAQAQHTQLAKQQKGDFEQFGLCEGAAGEYRKHLASKRPEPKGWDAQPLRDTGKMLVVRKQDGLAMQVKQSQGGGRGGGGGVVGKGGKSVGGKGKGAAAVSRHCLHVPSDSDLSALSLGGGSGGGGGRAGGCGGGGRLYPHGEPVPQQQEQQTATGGPVRRFGGGLGGGGGGVDGGGLSLTGAAVDFRYGVPAPAVSGSSEEKSGGRFVLDRNDAKGSAKAKVVPPVAGTGSQDAGGSERADLTLEQVVEKFGEPATKFIGWYRTEEGQEPPPVLVARILGQM